MRPVLHIPFSYLEIGLEVLSVAGVLFTVYTIVSRWPKLPETVPIHFSSEEPDRWGHKKVLLWTPVLVVILYSALTLFENKPHLFNYPVVITSENAAQLYHISRTMAILLKTELVWLMAYLQWQHLQIALKQRQRLNMMLLLLPCLLTVFVGIPLWTYLLACSA